MEIRDPVHGPIHILQEEIPIITHPFFQRLRNIKQLGLSEYVFPGATHTRFLHSLGVMRVGEKTFDKLFFKFKENLDLMRIKETFKMACLLHDVGHAPLSHSTESVMPKLSELNIDKKFLKNKENLKRQATHEDYTLKAITGSSFSQSFKHLNHSWGVETGPIADLVSGNFRDDSYFKIGKVNYFPLLSQLVSGELDCDRMDYLLRDSYFCGVTYGQYDLDWLLDNIQICVENDIALLGINERAVVTFDDFLLGRYHMFIMVYFHYRAVCLEKILLRYFKTCPGEYQIPPDIEKYIEHDDHYLLSILKDSTSPYAKAVINNQIPEKIYESFRPSQLRALEEIQKYLEKNNIEYIRCSSKGRLSKYYNDQNNQALNREHNIMVVRAMSELSKSKKLLKPRLALIDKSTDLFEKFSKAHAVDRLHCHLRDLNTKQIEEINEITEKYL